MKTSARISNLEVDFKTRGAAVGLIMAAKPEEVEKYKGKELDVEIKVHRENRSLDANAYYWVLVGQLAEANHLSRTEMHNRLLAEYGTEKIGPDGALSWAVKPLSFDWTKSEDEHYRFAEAFVNVTDDSGTTERAALYWVLKGSHEYNTKEMSRLIDGTVSEAKEAGIETLTPDELEHMKLNWKTNNYGGKEHEGEAQ